MPQEPLDQEIFLCERGHAATGYPNIALFIRQLCCNWEAPQVQKFRKGLVKLSGSIFGSRDNFSQLVNHNIATFLRCNLHIIAAHVQLLIRDDPKTSIRADTTKLIYLISKMLDLPKLYFSTDRGIFYALTVSNENNK